MLHEFSMALQQINNVSVLSAASKRQRHPQQITWVNTSSASHNYLTTYYEKHFQEINNRICAEQILEPFRLLEDDWDGNGSFAPTEKVLANSILLLSDIPSKILASLDQEDGITINTNGTLSFEWIKGNNKVFVEVGEITMSIFSKVEGAYKGIDSCDISYSGSLANSFIAAGIYA